MAVNGKHMTWTIQASADLNNLTAGTGDLYKAVDVVGNKSANSRTALGILQYGAQNTGHVTIAISGISKFVAGGAVSAGRGVKVTTNGYFVQAGSGDVVVGRCLDTAVASGAVGTGMFNFAVPYAVTDSLGLY